MKKRGLILLVFVCILGAGCSIGPGVHMPFSKGMSASELRAHDVALRTQWEAEQRAHDAALRTQWEAEQRAHDVALRAKWEAEQSARQAQIPVPAAVSDSDPNTSSSTMQSEKILCVRRGETPRALYARGRKEGIIPSEWGFAFFFHFLEEREYLHKGRCGRYLYAGDCVKIPQLSPP